MMNPLQKKTVQNNLGIILLALAAMLLRLWHLGIPSLRADTIVLWNICKQGISPADISNHWMEILGPSGQLPLPMMMIQFFLQATHLPVTEFNFRLLDVFWAGLAVFAVGQAGRRLLSLRAGLIWAGLMAIHPYFIQATREPYYYAPMICGLALLLWGAALVFRRYMGQDESLPAWQYVTLLILGTGLAVYSQPSGWGMVALIMAAVYAVLLFARRWRVLLVLSGVLGVLAIPMLIEPWGLTHIRALASAEHQQANLRLVAGEYRRPMLEHLCGVWQTFSWGAGLPRAIPAVLALLLWAEDLRRNRKNLLHWLIAALFLAGAVFSLAAQMRAVTFQTSRYMFSIFPLLLGGYAQGLAGLLDRLKKPLLRRIVQGAAVLFFFVPLLPPAVQAVRLTGSPTPYKDIVRWCDTQLPPGTPVLVDRWFEPWNELKVYPSTNVFFTFTVPNEPLDTFLQINWRKTAEQFFEKYPDAAYLEIAKTYWENPQVGPWSWPRQHFKQHVAIRNEAGISLRQSGLIYREDGGPYTNRLSVEVFYNTREDYLSMQRAQGRPLAMWYASGWSYTKTQDYRDWRVLQREAILELHNLTDSPISARLTVQALAAGGAKRVIADRGDAQTFYNGRMSEWALENLILQPGISWLVLRDPSPSGPPLLIGNIVLKRE